MLEETLQRKWHFMGTFVLVFAVSFASLFVLGYAPFRVEGSGSAEATAPLTVTHPTGPELPAHITISRAGVDAVVLNPTSTGTQTLDDALASGAVRYPQSAELNESGTVYLFAHSSYLKIVHNSAYKTFNGIQKLLPGDEIHVQSSTTDYAYRVTSMKLVDAETALIDLSNTGEQKLVLSTCDSFGEKSQRFVVEATFAGSSPLTK